MAVISDKDETQLSDRRTTRDEMVHDFQIDTPHILQMLSPDIAAGPSPILLLRPLGPGNQKPSAAIIGL